MEQKKIVNKYTWVNENILKFGNLNERDLIPEFILSMKRLTGKFNHKKIILDFTEVTSVKPFPAVPIAGYIDYYKKKGIEFEFVGASSYLTFTHFSSPLEPSDDTFKKGFSVLDKIWTFRNSTDVYLLTQSIVSSLRKSLECEKGVIESCEYSSTVHPNGCSPSGIPIITRQIALILRLSNK